MSYRADYEVVEPARMDIDAAPGLVLLRSVEELARAVRPVSRADLEPLERVLED